MAFVSFKRVIVFAFQNFWRNIWLSAVTVSIIALSLFSVSMLGAITVLSNQALAQLQDRVDISVYLKPDLPSDKILGMKQDVEQTPGVKSVDVVTAEEALNRFKEKHASNPLIIESLAELTKNPLGASLIVKAQSEQAYQGILASLESEKYSPLIQTSRFDDYRLVIDSLSQFTNRLKNIASIVSGLFTIITLLVVFNTIRVTIYTHRSEIAIMRLVGATSWFIRAPFWVESVIYAALATLITAAVFFPLLSFVRPYLISLFSGFDFDPVTYFNARSWWFFGSQFIGASLLNILASTVAMRRYLRI